MIKFYILSFLFIFAVSLIVLLPFFQLSFDNDDWFGIILYKSGSDWVGIFKPYGVGIWFMSVLYDFFGSNRIYYFILDFLLRVFASTSILIFIYKLTNSRLAALLGGLLFSIGFSGIQTTTDSTNMLVYVSVIGYLIFLYYFFLTRVKLSFYHITIMGVSLFSATLISPVRSYPLYVWVIIADILWLLSTKGMKANLKFIAIRFLVIFSIFSFLAATGTFGESTIKNQYLKDIQTFISKLFQFDSSTQDRPVFNFLTGLGNVILPNQNLSLEITGTGNVFLPNQSQATQTINFNTLIGFVYILVLLVFLVRNAKHNKLLLSTFLLWVPIFYLSYWMITRIIYNQQVMNSYARHMLIPYLGFVLSLSILIAILTNSNLKVIRNFVLLFALLIIYIHSSTLNYYLNFMTQYRNGDYVEKFWLQLQSRVPNLVDKSDLPTVFYFEFINSNLALYTINNGFTTRGSAMYKIFKIPSHTIAITSFKELVSIVTDGYELTRFGFQSKPLDWDRIYAFRIENDQLIDIKDAVIKQVEEVQRQSRNQ